MDHTELFAAADVIEEGDLVTYHGSIEALHGLWLAFPCLCGNCTRLDALGAPDTRFMLVDPWGERSGPVDVRRQSVTRANGCA